MTVQRVLDYDVCLSNPGSPEDLQGYKAIIGGQILPQLFLAFNDSIPTRVRKWVRVKENHWIRD